MALARRRRPTLAVGLAALLMSGVVPGARAATPPDPTFADNGVYLGRLGDPTALTTLADGSIVVTIKGARGISLAKFTSAGVLDTSVGGGSGVVGDGFAGDTTLANGVLVDRAGRIVVTGVIWANDEDGTSRPRLFAARYQPDLTLDTGFGDGGHVVLAPETAGQALRQAPDGSYVVAGESGATPRFAAFRLTADGEADPSFGTDGVATVRFAKESSATDLVVTPDNRVVLVGGHAAPDNGVGAAYLARLRPDGSPDPTFSGDGLTTVGGERFGAVVRLPGGSYVAAGEAAPQHSGSVRLVRLSTSGALQSWAGTSTSQRTFTPPARYDWNASDVRSLTLGPDRQLFLTASLHLIQRNENRDFLVRTDLDGVPDSSFGAGGQKIWTYPGQDDFESPGSTADGTVDAQGRALFTGDTFLNTEEREGSYSGLVRLSGSVKPRTPTFEIAQALSSWAKKSCGTTAAAACTYAAGGLPRIEGRVWPVPTGRTVTVNLVPTAGGDRITVADVPVSADGNVWLRLPDAPPAGRYTARIVTPASGTTTLARSPWTYLRIAAG